MSAQPLSLSRLENKHLLVAGVGNEIGRAIALRFRDEGAKVTAIDQSIDPDALPDIDTYSVDLADSTSLHQIAEASNKLHGIFTGFSHMEIGTLLASNVAQWHQTFDEVVHNTVHVLHAFLPTLIYAGGGPVTLLSSICGSVTGIENRCAYSTANAALVGLSKSIAVDYGSHGVRCNAICSGIFDTQGTQAQLAATGNYDGAREVTAERHILGRIGTLEELTNLAVYLASDESSFTTGQALVIDGGYSHPR
ncbi:MAG: SDR family oxidoreductase [Parvibaculaceae bacterium]